MRMLPSEPSNPCLTLYLRDPVTMVGDPATSSRYGEESVARATDNKARVALAWFFFWCRFFEAKKKQNRKTADSVCWPNKSSVSPLPALITRKLHTPHRSSLTCEPRFQGAGLAVDSPKLLSQSSFPSSPTSSSFGVLYSFAAFSGRADVQPPAQRGGASEIFKAPRNPT